MCQEQRIINSFLLVTIEIQKFDPYINITKRCREEKV